MDVVRHLRKSISVERIQQKGLFTFLVIIVVSFTSSCNSEQKISNKLQKHEILPLLEISSSLSTESSTYSIYSEQFNDMLLAELYSQVGKVELSAQYYKKLVTNSDNPAIAKRATILAATSGQSKEALEAVQLWINLLPDSLEAHQYYSLLLLRDNKFNESVEQLYKITQLVENSDLKKGANPVYSKGLKFIGSMLNIESHHEKSLSAFQHYIQKYGTEKNQTQQNLIISSLAMNAKKYGVVLSALNSVENRELIKSSKIILMKVEALQELNKVSEAVIILRSFVDKQQPSDSIRLQLVRLLILDHQNNVASPYLKELVRKHPDNNDLLKSLIALEIDQSQLQSARENIQKLSLTKEYHSDVAYFRGEIYEAEGDLQAALKNYQQVVDGSLQKRARKKIIKLSQGLKERNAIYKSEP